jgi:hypothetical protein
MQLAGARKHLQKAHPAVVCMSAGVRSAPDALNNANAVIRVCNALQLSTATELDLLQLNAQWSSWRVNWPAYFASRKTWRDRQYKNQAPTGESAVGKARGWGGRHARAACVQARRSGPPRTKHGGAHGRPHFGKTYAKIPMMHNAFGSHRLAQSYSAGAGI